ncbi:MAG: phosphoribosylglycinamide formyltransferase [Burkholderiaceae bacterium]
MLLRKRLVILISGRGSNMDALVRACRDEAWPADIVGVVASRPDTAGAALARGHGLPVIELDHRSHPDRAAFDEAMIAAIDPLAPDLVVLAGFMRILAPAFVAHYADRLINIHPSLLPAFPGVATHRQALAAGVRVHGATVHMVVNEVDSGRILAQAAVPVRDGDDEQALGERVLRAEHALYPMVVGWLVHDRMRLRGGEPSWRDPADAAPRWLWSDA